MCDQIKALQSTMELCDERVQRMETSLADDDTFKDEVRKLEEKFGQELIGADMRERLHLEKAHLYHTAINSNLEDALRQIQEARLVTGETAELLNSDTEKLRKAFMVVGYYLVRLQLSRMT